MTDKNPHIKKQLTIMGHIRLPNYCPFCQSDSEQIRQKSTTRFECEGCGESFLLE